jgi:hypothetical protein
VATLSVQCNCPQFLLRCKAHLERLTRSAQRRQTNCIHFRSYSVRLVGNRGAGLPTGGHNYAQSWTGGARSTYTGIRDRRKLLDRAQWPARLLLAPWRRLRLHERRQQEMLRRLAESDMHMLIDEDHCLASSDGSLQQLSRRVRGPSDAWTARHRR